MLSLLFSGYYQSSTGSTSCVPALPGYFVQRPGSPAYRSCTTPSYSKIGSHNCTYCISVMPPPSPLSFCSLCTIVGAFCLSQRRNVNMIVLCAGRGPRRNPFSSIQGPFPRPQREKRVGPTVVCQAEATATLAKAQALAYMP